MRAAVAAARTAGDAPVRPRDILFGRIGGEEFAALLPVGDLGEAYAIADRVRRNFAGIASRFTSGGLVPTVSVGVALCADAKSNVDMLLEVADRALYRAKANGRDRVEATTPRDELDAPPADAPSIVPLIGAERIARARRRAAS